MEIPTFSRNLSNARAATPYPHVEILDRSESVALMLKALESGDLPVVFNNKGMRVQIATIQLSALAIKELSKVSRLVWNSSADSSIELTSTDAIMIALSEYIKGR